MGFKERGGVRDDGHKIAVLACGRIATALKYREQIGDGQMLGLENHVHCLEGKLAAAMQKIGKMRLSKTGLASQQRDAQRPPLYPAEQLQA